MTDSAAEAPVTAPRRRGGRLLAVLRRIPATLSVVAVLLIAGILTGALWTPLADGPLWDVFAFGLPALQDGRWWTPITGSLLVSHPALYPVTIAGLAGVAFVEFRRGGRAALAYLVGGQLFAVLGASLLLWLGSLAPAWAWAAEQSALLDVAPEGGIFAGIAAAVGLFAAPWRSRAWLVLLVSVTTGVLLWGGLSQLEHALGVFLVLAVDRSLRVQRVSVSEQRFVAFVWLVALTAIDVITEFVPTDGPFGPSVPDGTVWDAAVNVIVIVVIANGLRRARRWAWAVAIVLAAANALVALLGLTLLITEAWSGVPLFDTSPSGDVAVGLMWGLLLIYLILVRRAFRWRRRGHLGPVPAPTVLDVVETLERDGGGTLSWMSTWEGNLYMRTTTGIVAYQRRAGAAIALGDPLGPEAGRADSAREFITAAEHAGLVPCFFSAGDATRAAVPAQWRSLVVADDTIVDLPGLAFTGKRWSDVRTSINRAGREEMTFRLTRLADEPFHIRSQLHAISEMWVGDRGLPEMRFTLGTLEEAADPHVPIALAISAHGDVDGFLSWLPIHGAEGRMRGWTLDLMRRREGGFGPVMEYLIGMSAAAFRDEGAEIMSLSGAPLAHEYPPEAATISALSDWLSDILEPVYGFQSLHRFKEKFRPRYETLSLLFRDEGDLARIGAGLTRAFLPDASLRQFAGAGLELLRGAGRD
ncbi:MULTISPECIES: bifunctional lysylphosphatidylglycerol flippase/synthetase MprF [Microbacterium]|uniref:bifunctional lysylphosphatidylglycerol flippase/synthetase MprF n=1 Tax=Microbacterium TaxID=33882 RepID=UPI00257D8E87|nr:MULTISPECIES: DUF2156 domain-containing protein [Microbacterium]